VTSKIDATAVINCHREGLIARPSLLSVSKAKAHAQRLGFNIEIIVVADRTDLLTKFVIENWEEPDVQILFVDNGDLGLSRNEAVMVASGEWISFIDADDLWGETWLSYALRAAKFDARNIVWHPEVSVIFGAFQYIYRHIDMETDEYDAFSLCAKNYWTSACMVRRIFCYEVPYPRTDLEGKIGFEDWSWNLSAIGRGAIHKVVINTGHAIRKKEDSLVKRTTQAGAVPKPDETFREYLFTVQAAQHLKRHFWTK